ncbi:MAG: CRTAC1 family protein [Acidobacteriota bacterium]
MTPRARGVVLLALAPLLLLASRRASRGFRLIDVARPSGLDFTHDGGRSGKMYITDTIGSGGTLFDADGDGDLDLYLVTGCPIEARKPTATNHLYLNDGTGTFAKAPPSAGVDFADFGMGAISLDFDGDGDQDLYLTNRGPNRLLANRGDATFDDVTARAGVGDPRWSSSAAAADMDGDGDLDLFVVNYVTFDPKKHTVLGYGGSIFTLGPLPWDAEPDTLYENEGDGTFRDVTGAAGVAGPGGKGLAVAFVDLDSDRDPDILVANDTTPNFLYENLDGARFKDVALPAGVAVNEAGRAEAGMGIAIGDYDEDGRQDFVVTNFAEEDNALQRNLGGLRFERRTRAAGLAPPGDRSLAFGVELEDFDDDGHLDLLVANGHISALADRLPIPGTYAQKPQLFMGEGGRFREVGSEAGDVLDRPIVGRATIAGDVDDDGDVDVVVTTVDGAPLLLANVAPAQGAGHFLVVALRGAGKNRDGVGAAVTVTQGGRRQTRVSRCGTSYLADGDPRLHVGFPAAGPAIVDVAWRSGATSRLEIDGVDRRVSIDEPSR